MEAKAQWGQRGEHATEVIVERAALPKTSTGKVDKVQLQ